MNFYIPYILIMKYFAFWNSAALHYWIVLFLFYQKGNYIYLNTYAFHAHVLLSNKICVRPMILMFDRSNICIKDGYIKDVICHSHIHHTCFRYGKQIFKFFIVEVLSKIKYIRWKMTSSVEEVVFQLFIRYMYVASAN